MTKYVILFAILFGGLASAKAQSDLLDVHLLPAMKTLEEREYQFSTSTDLPHVFIFYSIECPLSQKYTLTLNNLSEKYADKIKFVGVLPGIEGEPSGYNQFRDKYRIPYDLIKDERFALTTALGASITPEVFLVDQTGKTVYHGAIDDWVIKLGKTKQQATVHYLENAIAGLLNHTIIQPSYVKPFGCYIEQ